MNEQVSIVIIICSVATVVCLCVVLQVQLRRLLRLSGFHQAWEQEQLRDQQFWEVQQEKRMHELEARFTTQMQQIQGIWQHWEAENKVLVALQAQQYKQEITRMNLEYELQWLPRIEDVPLS